MSNDFWALGLKLVPELRLELLVDDVLQDNSNMLGGASYGRYTFSLYDKDPLYDKD